MLTWTTLTLNLGWSTKIPASIDFILECIAGSMNITHQMSHGMVIPRPIYTISYQNSEIKHTFGSENAIITLAWIRISEQTLHINNFAHMFTCGTLGWFWQGSIVTALTGTCWTFLSSKLGKLSNNKNACHGVGHSKWPWLLWFFHYSCPVSTLYTGVYVVVRIWFDTSGPSFQKEIESFIR